MPKKLAIDTCDRCGTTIGPIQIIFKTIGFDALCLECKKQYWREKQKDNRNTGPHHRPGTAGAGGGQNN